MLPTEDKGTMQIWNYHRVIESFRYSVHKELRKEIGNYLYFTTDEEIKEGDWYLYKNKPFQCPLLMMTKKPLNLRFGSILKQLNKMK